LTSYRDLYVSYGKQRFECLEFIGRLKELESVHIDGGQLTDDDFAIIASLPKLRRLEFVGWNHLSDRAILQLGDNDTLKVLQISGLDISLEVTQHLAGLHGLEELSLNLWAMNSSGKYGQSDADSARWGCGCDGAVERLAVAENRQAHGNVLSDEAVLACAELPHIKQIVYDPRFVSAETIAKLKTAFPRCALSEWPWTDCAGEFQLKAAARRHPKP
jgi:hypothetical protein